MEFETKEKYDFSDLIRILKILRAPGVPAAVLGTGHRIIILYVKIL